LSVADNFDKSPDRITDEMIAWSFVMLLCCAFVNTNIRI
jgi:hypothetical protein